MIMHLALSEKPNFIKYVILMGFLFLFPRAAYSLDKAVVLKDQINVRVDSTVMSPVLGYLRYKETVAIIEEKFGWCKIVLPKRFSAFAASEFLKKVADNKVEVTASNLNLRNKPAVSSYVIGNVDRGTVLFFRKKKGQWFELRGYPYTHGWVNENFLEKLELVR